MRLKSNELKSNDASVAQFPDVEEVMECEEVNLEQADSQFNVYDYVLETDTGLDITDFATPALVNWVMSNVPLMEIMPSQLNRQTSMLPNNVVTQPPSVPIVTKALSKLSLESDSMTQDSTSNANISKEDVVVKKGAQKCKICFMDNFANIRELREHLKGYHKVRITDGMRLSSKSSNSIFGDRTSNSKCQHCQKIFKDQREELAHQSITKENVPCLACTMTFKCIGPWTSHFHKEHLQGTQSLQCVICKSTLSSKNNLSNHYKTHLKDIVYKCKVCGSSFRTVKGLYNHLLVHSDSVINAILEARKAITVKVE